ncbi:hypothetical protein AB0B12_24965 [Streptomyces sp. NPDC044780]|uniref:MmyB family transcriptional regulator n=1 Tax=unclassified Streptomyces TaxID=2593676 RepID=UPI0033D54D90
MRAASGDFRRMGAEHEVAVERTDRKTVIHPRVGPLLLDCETLVGIDHQQRLMVLTPADQESRERLRLLQVLGLQELPQTYGTPSPDGDIAAS